PRAHARRGAGWVRAREKRLGLSVRLAVGLNRVMRRRGRVFADRYHAHVLRTPTEVRRAVSYVRDNFRRHRAQTTNAPVAILTSGWVDPCSSEANAALPEPSSWLLKQAARDWRGAT